jgi:hypothetical protein
MQRLIQSEIGFRASPKVTGLTAGPERALDRAMAVS